MKLTKKILKKYNIYKKIEQSGLFDKKFYRRKYSLNKFQNPILHYLYSGSRLNNDPSAEFSTEFYLINNPDVKEAGVNPLYHYILHGKSEGRLPKESEAIVNFSSSYLLPKGTEGLKKFRQLGVFSPKLYSSSYSDLMELNENQATAHFVDFGSSEYRFRNTNIHFAKYYNMYGNEFLDALLAEEKLINFMKDKVEEDDLAPFLHFFFKTCTIKKSTFCFDIFDTLIYRNFVNPEDVFSFVELKTKCWGFTEKRIAAESKCKEIYGNKQYLLSHIYEQIDLLPEVSAKFMSLELEVERENISIRKSVFSFLEEIEKNGHEIVLISDYYLVKDDLIKILPTEFSKYADKIYVSGDSGFCKHSKELYLHFFNSHNVETSNTFMIGDNFHSDYVNALQSGFDSAIRIPTINETALRKYFDLLLDCDLWIKKEIKKSAIENGDVVIPVLAGAVISIAKYMNLVHKKYADSELLVLGRDGHLVKRVYSALYNKNIIEVPNSRSLNFNCIIESEAEVNECLSRDGFEASIKNTLKERLGFEYDGLFCESPISYFNGKNLTKQKLCDEVIRYSSEQRALYREHCRDIGIENGGDYLLFDIGYRGTSARAFKKLLPQSNLKWIYYATFDTLSFNHDYDSLNPELDLNIYGETLPILEALLSDCKVNSAHYFDNSNLIRRQKSESKRLCELVSTLQDKVVDIARRYAEQNGTSLNLEPNSHRAILKYLKSPHSKFSSSLVGVANEDVFANATSYIISPNFEVEMSSWKSGLDSLLEEVEG